jgi:uncharacterized protein (DUF1697 family)
LRAVNVVGRNKVAMADLRDLAGDLGLSNPRTLLQSGNLVFETDDRSAADLESLLKSETSTRLGIDTDYLIRSAQEWREIVAGNPFPAEAEDDPGHLLVMPLKSSPEADDVATLQASIKDRELVRHGSRHVYLVYPDGVGRSKLTTQRIEKAMRSRGTARNWNTALKLLAMVEGA